MRSLPPYAWSILKGIPARLCNGVGAKKVTKRRWKDVRGWHAAGLEEGMGPSTIVDWIVHDSLP